jgi:predicted MPP superfamily phosphohydrolase
MPMRVLVFLSIATLLAGIMHVWLERRLIRRSRVDAHTRRLARIVLATATISMLLCFVVGRGLPDGFWTRPLNWVGFTSMGILSILFALTVVRDLGLLARWSWRRVARGSSARQPAAVATDTQPSGAAEPISRRIFLTRTSGGLVLVSGFLVSLAGFFRAVSKPVVERVVIELDNLPPAFEGFRIAQISDLHVGPTLRRSWLRNVIDQVNGLEADLIAVTGDVIDGRVEDLREVVAPLGDLRAADGVFFVTGNHEYYWDAEAWVAEFRTLGLEPLLNEHRLLSRGGASMLLAGVTDVRADDILPAHRSDPAGARAGAPETPVSLLLAHQPRSLYAAREAGYDLQLSGHTHGGQYFPWNLVIHLLQPAVAGHYRFGPLQVYVNRGTGYWGPPLRSGANAEISLVELRRTPA